jgi:hypothetical protein
MTRIILLDSGPLGLLAHPRMAEPLENWVSSLLRSAADVCVPEVVYYELRRELVRLRNVTAIPDWTR